MKIKSEQAKESVWKAQEKMRCYLIVFTLKETDM